MIQDCLMGFLLSIPVAFFFAGIIFLAMLPLTILRGWALSVLWGWFAVPLGLPILSVVNAMGIMLIVSVCSTKSNSVKESSDLTSSEFWSELLVAALAPIFAISAGYIYNYYM